MNAHNAAAESPNTLTNGGWYPRTGSPALHWHPGAEAPAWQDVSGGRCGSHAGIDRHRRARTPLCELCRACKQDSERERYAARRKAA